MRKTAVGPSRSDRGGTEARTIASIPFLQSYGYDADGNRTSIGYPSGRVVTYTHDYAGRPLTAAGTHTSQSTAYVTAATYLPFGPVTSLTLGNGTVETRTYDSRYLPLTNSLTAGATTIAQYVYDTDPAGNITGIADGINAGYSRTFGYDDLNRLTSANTGGALWVSASFTYDRMGNMLTGPGLAFTYQGTTPKISTATGMSTAMTYDAAGNELKTPAGVPTQPTAVYSPRNLLTTQYGGVHDTCGGCNPPDLAEKWLSHVYDGRGIRVLTYETNIGLDSTPDLEQLERFYFYTPELKMLNVVASSTRREADVIWFGNRPVADHDPDAPRYTFTDHLGTPLLQTSTAATIAWRVEHAPFGNVHALRAGSATDDQPLRFPGQQVAFTVSGAGEENYNIFRWYRAGFARYTQADPLDRWPYISRDERHTKTFHPYAYADGSPVGLVDALGLDVSPGGPLKKDCWGKCVELYDKEMFLCKTFKVNDEKNCAVGLANCVAKMILAPFWAPDCKKKYEICKSNLGSRWEQCISKASIIYQNCLYENKCCQ